jgi:hypothetical protein
VAGPDATEVGDTGRGFVVLEGTDTFAGRELVEGADMEVEGIYILGATEP